MKRPYFPLAALLVLAMLYMCFKGKDPESGVTLVSTFGKQPAIAVDRNNTVKVAFGQGVEIFYTSSLAEGQSFAKPQRVGAQPKLALGMTRGPQITTTRDYTVIAAADHTGRILVYRLKNKETQWSKPVNLLETDTTAKEGFVVLATGKGNTVYAAWLDLRLKGHNNIFSASSPDGGKTWTRATLVYAAPEGKVCPCCRPSISADQEGNVYIMFRNELNGARDMYLAHSKDGGKSFSQAQKMGMDTWKLKACPMDGGGIALDAGGKVVTTWRRESSIYMAYPGAMEKRMGEGRAGVVASSARGNYLVWQQNQNIMALSPDHTGAEVVGTGTFPKVAILKDQNAIAIWEKEGQIVARRLQ